MGGSHNYYLGRAEADCSQFVEYFCRGMAESFAAVRRHAEEAGSPDAAPKLRELNAVQRQALGLFRRQRAVSSRELAAFLKLKPRNAAILATKWLKAGFLELANASKKARRYRLAKKYEALIMA